MREPSYLQLMRIQGSVDADEGKSYPSVLNVSRSTVRGQRVYLVEWPWGGLPLGYVAREVNERGWIGKGWKAFPSCCGSRFSSPTRGQSIRVLMQQYVNWWAEKLGFIEPTIPTHYRRNADGTRTEVESCELEPVTFAGWAERGER